MKKANRIAAFSLVGHLLTGLGYAQNIDPWLADGINKNIQRNRDATAQYQQQAQQQQWQAEEDRIQRKIAKFRATPYYGSLGVSRSNPGPTAWSGGGKVSKELAERKAMEACGKSDCFILATFYNTCVGAASPKNMSDGNQWIVDFDNDPKRAVVKANEKCEKKYGKGECLFASNSRVDKHFPTFCSGYDYEAYEQNR